MLNLEQVTIHKYKSIEEEQTFDVSDDFTVLVGMNESGKSAILEAIAKTNYFTDDQDFKFNLTHDYPRKDKKKVDKSGEDPIAITCKYSISNELVKKIENDLGKGVFKQKEFCYSKKFSNRGIFNDLTADSESFFKEKLKDQNIEKEDLEKIKNIKSTEDFYELLEEYSSGEENKSTYDFLKSLEPYFELKFNFNSDSWLTEYVARTYLDPKFPKFLYYDEYYSLPSEVELEKIKQGNFEEEELKTAKALFDIADINLSELLESDEFEDYKAELEATQTSISDVLFDYWSTNKNLDIEFDIYQPRNSQSHFLNVRVKNHRTKVSLPLRNRSKGFNWFFSFLVWFKKIQEDNNYNYVLLLDEPGLNLHASAQEDLLKFIKDLTKDYQVIYTTHSPFMIDSERLDNVRTIYEDNKKGSIIHETIQEKDPNTLFPLQAALGYDIAQNLFISKNNLLVEGVSDLVYLNFMSNLLLNEGRTSLDDKITIVPTGGADKISTFISLLRGSKLNTICLLDSTSKDGMQKLNDLVKQKIIQQSKIKTFDEFTTYKKADIEDLFEKSEYLELFNEAFSEYSDLKESDLNDKIDNIIIQLNQKLGIDRFNHYRPAYKLIEKGKTKDFFKEETLDRFENLFKTINKNF